MSLSVKNMLGGGKPEGLYVWKKYEIGTSYIEKTTQHEAQSNGIVITKGLTFNSNMTVKVTKATSYTFDSATGKYTLKNNISSFDVVSGVASGSTSYSTALNGYYFMLGDDTEADYMYKGCDSYSIGFTNNGDGTCKMWEQYVGNPIYAYSADTEPTYTFLDYIVSDKETAYPDGGEKGGYWYERFVERLTPEMFGCSKMVIDEFVVASRTSTSSFASNISHSLGEVPKVAIISLIDNLSSLTNKDVFFLMRFQDAFGGSNSYHLEGYNDGTTNAVTQMSSGYGTHIDTMTDSNVPLNCPSSTYYWQYFAVGTYKVITMA